MALQKEQILNMFIENLVDKDLIEIEKNKLIKFYDTRLNYKIDYLLTVGKKKLGINIRYQFDSGSTSDKIIYFLDKIEQSHIPILLIYLEDRSFNKNLKHDNFIKLITNKHGVYLNYSIEENKIIEGIEILLDKMKFYLELK